MHELIRDELIKHMYYKPDVSLQLTKYYDLVVRDKIELEQRAWYTSIQDLLKKHEKNRNFYKFDKYDLKNINNIDDLTAQLNVLKKDSRLNALIRELGMTIPDHSGIKMYTSMYSDLNKELQNEMRNLREDDNTQTIRTELKDFQFNDIERSSGNLRPL